MTPEDRLSAWAPITRVKLSTVRGEFEASDSYPPVTPEELFIKFHDYADPILTQVGASRVLDMVMTLDELEQVSVLTDELSGPLPQARKHPD